ncbi:hypothetical protein CFIMG_004064RA [Ceratocystis fimbriata CBS 114723]|uniref:Rhodopsin domain-containing protein n=1 Tax=Ceratocystis fimbriata CBS 114723 TaxID=1035309 RepID=A0A2C5X0R4_9PEZI|nr:hypothetical protein CFIMG_004064RA [Ceratocystis fimbriata CBS 114723]
MSAFISNSLGGSNLLSDLEFTDNKSHKGALNTINYVCLAATITITLLRTGVRLHINRKLFWEDTILIISSVFNCVLIIVTLYAVKYGVGSHVWTLDLSNINYVVKRIVQLILVSEVMYMCALAATKVSIMVLYFRIFPSQKLRRLVWAVSIFTILFTIASVLATIFQCQPAKAAWDFLVEGKCYTFVNFLYANAAVSLATDILVLAMPMPLLWRLTLPTKQKLAICSLFMLGAFACVAGIVRITFLEAVTGLDVSYRISKSLIWSIIEVTVGIICGSVPHLRPLFTHIIPGRWGSSHISGKNVYELSSTQKRTKPSQKSYADLPEGAIAAIQNGNVVHVHTHTYMKEEPAYGSGNSTEELTATGHNPSPIANPSGRGIDLMKASRNRGSM